MGRIPEQTISDIRSRIDIVDLIGRHVALRKAGRNYKGLCPFHDEKTPSFNVNPDRQAFYCFGCHAGGDVIGFRMRHEGLTFPEAARALARQCGIEIPEQDSGERGLSERLFEANEVAQALYLKALAGREGAGAREYLDGRGLDSGTIERFGIGFAPSGWDAVVSALARARIPSDLGARAGLLAERDSGGHYDRLRGRVTFPIRDATGRIVGFGGRALADDQQPKYLNTPESPIFHKRSALYGLPFSLEGMRRAERAIVCEGYFDCIALHRAGLSEAVATCGTALTPEHAKALRRRARSLVLLFDGDAAGQAAAERSLPMLLPEGLRVRAAALPSGHDPDTWLAERGADALRSLVDEAPDAVEFAMRRALSEGVATPAAKADAVSRVAPLIAQVSDPVERTEHTRRLAQLTDADLRAVESVVRDQGRRVAEQARRVERRESERSAVPIAPIALDPREERHLSRLAGLLLQSEELAERTPRSVLESLLPDGPWKELALALVAAPRGLESSGRIDSLLVESQLSDGARDRLRAIAVEELPHDEEVPVAQVLDDHLRWFARRHFKARKQELTRRMRDPDADVASLLQEKERIRREQVDYGLGSKLAT